MLSFYRAILFCPFRCDYVFDARADDKTDYYFFLEKWVTAAPVLTLLDLCC